MLDCQSFHLPSMSRQKKAEHRSAASTDNGTVRACDT